MNTMSEVDRLTSEVYADYVACVEPTMEKEARSKARGSVEWEGTGMHLMDLGGVRYLDAAGGGGVFGLGYRHPRVVASVMEQLQRMPMSSRAALNPLYGQLARRLAGILPEGLQYSFITCTGSEAVEVALKVARLATKRADFVSTQASFHGMTFAATCVGGIPYLHDGVKPVLAGTHQVPYGDLGAMQAAVTERTAAVILEPIHSAGGCLVPPDGYLRGVRDLCRHHGALLIADEIQTAFRTGTVLGCSHEDVVPDIAILGKILGGGVMPIGAAVWSPAIQAFVSKKPLFNNSTFGGNQLACAAALTALDVIESEGLVARAASAGVTLRSELDRLVATYPGVLKKAEGRGLMQAVELQDLRYLASIIPRLMLQQRLIVLAVVFALNRIRINPPLIASDEELASVVERLERCLAVVATLKPEMIQRTWDRWAQGEPPELD